MLQRQMAHKQKSRRSRVTRWYKKALAIASMQSPLDEIRILASKPEPKIRKRIIKYAASQIKQAFCDDRWLGNYMLNIWECETGKEVLESYPWNIALPIADICNARCTFCNSWLAGTKILEPEQLKPFLEVLPYARLIGIQGHGEPLANPHIETILGEISQVIDRRTTGYIITNGVFLKQHKDRLLESCVTTFNISLNAVTDETHNAVMGLGHGKIDQILDAIGELVELRDTARPDIELTISMVLTAENIHEAADFVELGNRLGVNAIYLRSLMPLASDELTGGLNYHLLSPWLAPGFQSYVLRAREAIENSAVPVEAQPETWDTDVLSPQLRAAVTEKAPPIIRREDALRDRDLRKQYSTTRSALQGAGRQIAQVNDLKFNPYERTTPFNCRFIYQNLITTKLSMEMYPCCYMTEVPGHEPVILSNERTFMEQWNNPAFVNLRQRLRHGPLYQACATCPMQG